MIKKNISLSVIFLFCFFTNCVFAQNGNRVTISVFNKETIAFKEHVISIPWKTIIEKYSLIDAANFKIINAKTKKEIPFQLEYIGESTIQNLLLQVDIAPRTTVKFYLIKGKHTIFPIKTYCRYVPERKDDFAWENDRIAFRMYGKALENTKENANGIDVWVKRTDKLVINERYKRGEYHQDHGDGLDYYHVGLSLGAGNIAPYFNDSIYFPKNYKQWKVLDIGPLRCSFQLFYDEWDVKGNMVKMVKTVSLDAGSQLNRIKVNYTSTKYDTLPIVVGIIKREAVGTILLEEQNAAMAYWEPKSGDNGITGVGTIFLNPVVSMNVSKLHLLTHTTAITSEPFIYYTGAAWNKAGIITTAQEWLKYIQEFKQQLKQPLQIKLL
jgi:hypothetical protein